MRQRISGRGSPSIVILRIMRPSLRCSTLTLINSLTAKASCRPKTQKGPVPTDTHYFIHGAWCHLYISHFRRLMLLARKGIFKATKQLWWIKILHIGLIIQSIRLLLNAKTHEDAHVSSSYDEILNRVVINEHKATCWRNNFAFVCPQWVKGLLICWAIKEPYLRSF